MVRATTARQPAAWPADAKSKGFVKRHSTAPTPARWCIRGMARATTLRQPADSNAKGIVTRHSTPRLVDGILKWYEAASLTDCSATYRKAVMSKLLKATYRGNEWGSVCRHPIRVAFQRQQKRTASHLAYDCRLYIRLFVKPSVFRCISIA